MMYGSDIGLQTESCVCNVAKFNEDGMRLMSGDIFRVYVHCLWLIVLYVNSCVVYLCVSLILVIIMELQHMNSHCYLLVAQI